MSDPRTPAGAKPMWTRCPGCKDRIFNDKLDIGIHRQHCPADMQRTLQEVLRKFEDLRQAVGQLDEQVSEGPVMDADAVAEWPGNSDELLNGHVDDPASPIGVADYFDTEEDETDDEPDYGVSRQVV